MDNDEKIIKAFLYETLVNGLLANASLAYYREGLVFDNCYINNILEVIIPHEYLSRIEDLKREEEDLKREEEEKDD